MKKPLLTIIILCVAICSALCAFTACSGETNIELSFVVDNETVKIVNTTGNEKIEIPDDPEKTGYTFDGWYWDKGTWETPFTANSLLNAPISKNMSIYAKFKAIEYTATFVADKEQVGTAKFTIEDTEIANIPQVPKKVGYKGIWEAYTIKTEDITINAVYTINKYTLIWQNEDGTVLKTAENIEYGTVLEYDGETPQKTADAQYTYTFDKWQPVVSEITGDITYTATYSTTINKYTVVWKNEDGTVLEIDENVSYGEMPEYNGAEPTKTGNQQYSYVFENKWSPVVETVKGEVEYISQFTQVTNRYKIAFYDEDGRTKLGESTVDYGTNATYPNTTPTKASDNGYNYTFTKWLKLGTTEEDNLGNVVADRNVYAKYTATLKIYNVYFVENGGSDINDTNYTYSIGLSALPDENNISKTGYSFEGWKDEQGNAIAAISAETYGDITLYAQWQTITYYASFYADETLVDTKSFTVEDTAIANIPVVPEKTGYTGKWEEYAITSHNITVNAIYIINKFTIVWKNYDGSVLKTDTIEYDTMPVYNGNAPTRNPDTVYSFTFTGWSPTVEKATQNAEYIATFVASESTSFVISYDANGGTNAPSSQTKNKGQSITLSNTLPSNGDHVFMGWKCAYDGNTYKKGATFNVDANVTLYAVWGHICDNCSGTGTASYKENCSTCSGSGKTTVSNWVDCSSCKGSGTISYSTACSSCKGFGGDVLCQCTCGNSWWANQQGNRICSSCGKVVSGTRYTTCSSCSGTGTTKAYKTCSACSGSGGKYVNSSVNCSKCNGVGYFEKTKTCTVCNGGKYVEDSLNTYTLTLKNGNSVFKTMSVSYGAPYKLTVPTKVGYSFDGWFDSINGGKQYTDCLGVSLNIWDIATSKTLYAHWILNHYSINYDHDTYVDINSLPTSYTVEDKNIVLPEQTREHYIFNWQLDSENISEINTSLAKDIILKAVWTPITYSISCDLNGGEMSGSQIPDNAVKYNGHYYCVYDINLFWEDAKQYCENLGGHLVTITSSEENDFLINYLCSKYYYIGGYKDGNEWKWVTGEDWNYTNWNSGEPNGQNAMEDKLEYWTNKKWNDVSNGGKDRCFICEWDCEYLTKYTIESVEFTLNNPIKDGYEFIGWTGFNGEISQKDLIIPTGTSGNLTLTANWQINQYTISFNSNGGSAVAEITQDYGTSVTAPSKPSWVEKSFVGWFDKTLTNEYEFSTMPAENITLYAKWIEYAVALTCDEKTAISVNDAIDSPLTYNATAIDTDGEEIYVSVQLINGTQVAGNTVSVRVTATGKYGVYDTKTISNIKVYGTPSLEYDTEKDYFNLSDTLNAELFLATATDTFGAAIIPTVSVKENEYNAGDVVTVVISATDITGNIIKAEIENVKVFGSPIITRNTEKNDMKAIDIIDNTLFGISATDSFGEELAVTTVKESGTITGGNTITVKSSATDSKGNYKEISYQIRVYGLPTISNAEMTDFKVQDQITLETLGIVAKDSFNSVLNNVTLELVGGEQVAGATLTCIVTATDHLGNMQTKEISGIKIYGTPTITFNTEKTAIKDTDTVNAGLFSATAKDSHNGNLDVNVTLESGIILGGNIVTIRFTATDHLGNEYSTVSQNLKVCSEQDIVLTFNAAAATRIKKSSKGEEFGTIATDTFGEPCDITIKLADGFTLAGGNVVNLYLIATDNAGNIKQSDLITGISVYDMPVLSYARENPYISKTDSPYALFSLKDSFDSELLFNAEVISGSLDINDKIVYRITGKDRLGNEFTGDYELYVLSENESVLMLYHNGEKVGEQRVIQGDGFILPSIDEETYIWYLDGIAITNENGENLFVWNYDSSIYEITAGYDFEFILSDNEEGYIIIDYVGMEADVIIPQTHQKLPIIGINGNAFKDKTHITSVTIPDSVIMIGDGAFKGCVSLINIVIPSGIKSMGDRAFQGCSSLKEIAIPDSVISIGEGLFSGCSSLESLTIPFVGNRAGVKDTDTNQYTFGYIFGADSFTGGVASEQIYIGNGSNVLINYYIPSALKSVTVTGGYIPYCAFRNCNNILSVTIKDNVSDIGSYAFIFCTNLNTIQIGKGVTNIAKKMFKCCYSLQTVTLDGNVISIGNYAFEDCTSLTKVNYTGTKTEWQSIDKGSYWKYNVPTSCKVYCSNGVISI